LRITNDYLILGFKAMKYNVVLEKGRSGYGAYVTDLPGCIAAAKTKKETFIVQFVTHS